MWQASVDEMYLDISAPARALLDGWGDGAHHSEANEGGLAAIFAVAATAGTHVAGASEGEEELTRGAQPGGILARNSFRAGHSGQAGPCQAVPATTS